MLNIQEIVAINRIIVDDSNEPFAILNKNSLMSLPSYDQELFGITLYPTIEDKISFVVVSLIKNHCFANGNKRTALAVLYMLTENNKLNIPNDNELFSIIITTATNKFDVQKFKSKIFKEKAKMLNYQEWKNSELNEAKLPDIGETVAFEDEVDVKINGKKMTIKPNQEVEVVASSGNQIELKCKTGTFHLTAAEYKAHGGHLI